MAIYADEDGYVNVEMLNPEAIFTLFFTDVLFGEQMNDAGYFYWQVYEPLGPNYRSLKQVANPHFSPGHCTTRVTA